MGFRKTHRRTKKRGGTRQRGGATADELSDSFNDVITISDKLESSDPDSTKPLKEKVTEFITSVRTAITPDVLPAKEANIVKLKTDLLEAVKAVDKAEKDAAAASEAAEAQTPPEAAAAAANIALTTPKDQNLLRAFVTAITEAESKVKAGNFEIEISPVTAATLPAGSSAAEGGGKRRKSRRHGKKKAKKPHHKKKRKSRRKKRNTRRKRHY